VFMKLMFNPIKKGTHDDGDKINRKSVFFFMK